MQTHVHVRHASAGVIVRKNMTGPLVANDRGDACMVSVSMRVNADEERPQPGVLAVGVAEINAQLLAAEHGDLARRLQCAFQ